MPTIAAMDILVPVWWCMGIVFPMAVMPWGMSRSRKFTPWWKPLFTTVRNISTSTFSLLVLIGWLIPIGKQTLAWFLGQFTRRVWLFWTIQGSSYHFSAKQAVCHPILNMQCHLFRWAYYESHCVKLFSTYRCGIPWPSSSSLSPLSTWILK